MCVLQNLRHLLSALLWKKFAKSCHTFFLSNPSPKSRISKIYYGTDNKNNGISDKIFEEININKNVYVEKNILENKCKKIIQDFFKKQRK